MIYAPTCSHCGHQFKEEENLAYGPGYEQGVEWFGGIQVITISDNRRID